MSEKEKVETTNMVETIRDSKHKESKSVNEKNAKIVLEYLRRCTPYESDAIRVMVGLSEFDGDLSSIKKEDLLAVNRFLNYGHYREDGDTPEVVLAHRQKRAQTLMKSVATYVAKDAIIQVIGLLMMISSDTATLNTTCKNLPNKADESKATLGKPSASSVGNSSM